MLFTVASAALAGDAWVTLATEDDAFHVHVPAAAFGKSSPVTVDGQSVDVDAIVAEIQRSPEGTKRTIHLRSDDGDPLDVTFANEAPSGPLATGVGLTVAGGKGLAMTLSFPLDGSGLGQAMNRVDDGGVKLSLDDDVAATLRRYPATVLFRARSAHGGELRIETR